jgi:hypothetical protein
MEGVTKYQLQFTPGPAVPDALLRELDAWRSVLYRCGLIGRDPLRYGGLAYGNVSMRLPDGGGFAISGTQTGGLAQLTPRRYAIVTACDARANRVVARGPIAPSSECLAHGALYDADAATRFVYHVHSPEVWRATARLGLPATPAGADYGTPAMADAVAHLMRDRVVREHGVLVMLGHEDGVIAFGADAATAGCTLLRTLAAAIALSE